MRQRRRKGCFILVPHIYCKLCKKKREPEMVFVLYIYSGRTHQPAPLHTKPDRNSVFGTNRHSRGEILINKQTQLCIVTLCMCAKGKAQSGHAHNIISRELLCMILCWKDSLRCDIRKVALSALRLPAK